MISWQDSHTQQLRGACDGEWVLRFVGRGESFRVRIALCNDMSVLCLTPPLWALTPPCPHTPQSLVADPKKCKANDSRYDQQDARPVADRQQVPLAQVGAVKLVARGRDEDADARHHQQRTGCLVGHNVELLLAVL